LFGFQPKKSTLSVQRLLQHNRPSSDICTATKPQLFDNLVGGGEQRQRHGEAKCLRGLEVDDEQEFGRLLRRKVAGFFTFEDAIDVARSSPE
jgi:hypothetical protein